MALGRFVVGKFDGVRIKFLASFDYMKVIQWLFGG